MPSSALSVLTIAFAALVALWPAGFLVVAIVHALARRWRDLGQIAWLVPLWSIAASIGLVQWPRLAAAFEPGAAPGRSLVAFTAVVFALCCAGVAWALLLRSAMRPRPLADR